MKKYIFLAIILVFAGVLRAQSTFEGGLVLGGVTSQIDGDGAAGYYRAGLSVGVFGQYRPVERLALNMELLYDQLGSNNRGVKIISTSYASVPILLGAVVPVHLGSDEYQVMFHGGLSPGYLINAEDQFGYDFSRYLRQVDLRGLIGGEFRVGNRLAVNIRYGHSIVPLANPVSVKGLILYTEQLGPWHRYWQASLRMYFGQ